MTEFWKSNPNFWCEYCKVWMQDNAQARATHERGMKHQENVAKRLREMRKKQETERRGQKEAAASINAIEAAAAEQYKKDMEAQKVAESSRGSWEPDEGTGYYYNAAVRYYYDRKTGMYYGGEPAAWIVTPPISSESLFKEAGASNSDSKKLPAASLVPSKVSGDTSKRLQVVSKNGATGGFKPGQRLADVGGYRMPETGKIGAAKMVGVQVGEQPVTIADAPRQVSAVKRKAGGGGGRGRPLSEEEQEAVARREAARARVQNRTMQTFGLTQ